MKRVIFCLFAIGLLQGTAFAGLHCSNPELRDAGYNVSFDDNFNNASVSEMFIFGSRPVCKLVCTDGHDSTSNGQVTIGMGNLIRDCQDSQNGIEGCTAQLFNPGTDGKSRLELKVPQKEPVALTCIEN